MSYNVTENNYKPNLFDAMTVEVDHADGKDVETLEKFKAEWQKVKDGQDMLAQANLIAELCRQLAANHGKAVEVGVVLAEQYDGTRRPNFSPISGKVTLTMPLRIVEALHETAHAVFGAEEKVAYAWSIQLFKKGFEKSFWENVENGRMLLRG